MRPSINKNLGPQPRGHCRCIPGRPKPTRAAGFTLIEASLTMVIIATGVLAIISAQEAYHKKNDWASRTGTAVLLANEIRELMLTLPTVNPITGKSQLGPTSGETVASFVCVYDFSGTVTGGVGAGTTFSPPINSMRQVIPNMSYWTQYVLVENVLPDNISSTLAQPLGSTNTVRVTVTISYKGPYDAAPYPLTNLRWVCYE